MTCKIIGLVAGAAFFASMGMAVAGDTPSTLGDVTSFQTLSSAQMGQVTGGDGSVFIKKVPVVKKVPVKATPSATATADAVAAAKGKVVTTNTSTATIATVVKGVANAASASHSASTAK